MDVEPKRLAGAVPEPNRLVGVAVVVVNDGPKRLADALVVAEPKRFDVTEVD